MNNNTTLTVLFQHEDNDVMCCTASVLNITCISIDRYIAITDPLRYTHTDYTKSGWSLICCTWVISAFMAYVPVNYKCYPRTKIHISCEQYLYN